MFLKAFDAIFIALTKNVKATLLAILLSVFIWLIYFTDRQIESEKKSCDEERRADQAIIVELSAELKDMRVKMFDAMMFDKSVVSKNDSIIRTQTKDALNQIK